MLQGIEKLIIKQEKEWAEIITDFETANKYKVFDGEQNLLFGAFEEKGNWFLRTFLKSSRPFTLNVLAGQELLLQVKRPWRWFFPQATIFDSNTQELATVKMRFAFFSRKYSFYDAQGQEIMSLHGPFFKPWTFNILDNGERIGKITKKWSGAFKEMFTDADVFGAEFPAGWDERKKKIILGTIFLIDFVHFEDRD
jgi:uncharacterized protein YxjI